MWIIWGQCFVMYIFDTSTFTYNFDIITFFRYRYYMYVVLMTYSFIMMCFKVRTRNGALERSVLVGCQPSRQLSHGLYSSFEISNVNN